MSLRTCCRNFSLICVLLALAILATPAFAGSADPTLCLQTQYNQVQKQKLNCSANDVRVAAVSNVRALDGSALSTCIEGSKFSFVADFNVVTTANATNAGGRDNIGLYFQTDPTKTDALSGNTCTDNIIAPVHPCGPAGTPLAGINCGTTGYKEFDASPDNCGDTSSSVNGNITDTIVVQDFVCTTSNTVPCASDPTKQCLSLPNCTSWQVPGSSILCVTPPPAYPYPFDASNNPEAIPGAPSKCNCSVIPLPIQPVNPKPLALKACNTKNPDTTPTFTFNPNSPPGTASLDNCNAGAEGVDTATYTVAVDNPNVSGSFGDIIVEQICDSAYGQIFPASGSCAKGSQCSTAAGTGCATGTTCSALDVPLDSAQGVFDNFQTCNFTAPSIGELNTVQNIVTVSGHSKVNNTVTFSTQTNQVTVHSSDAPTSATVTKSALATLAACATVNYQVEVDNTSTTEEAGALETLSILNDKQYGDITKVGGSVLATTCAVGGTIAVGTPYKCTFSAQFCSGADNLTGLDANGCFSHTNTVTATLKGDEATDPTFGQDSNTLIVKECIAITP